MKYLGLDFGGKRIGVAISDDEMKIAFPRITLENSPSVIADIKHMCEEEGVDAVVLGIPVSLSGGISAQAESVRRFGESLHEALGLLVLYENELYTTKMAKTDEGAAALILQGYLDRRSRKKV